MEIGEAYARYREQQQEVYDLKKIMEGNSQEDKLYMNQNIRELEKVCRELESGNR
jgi:hypothetical protein